MKEIRIGSVVMSNSTALCEVCGMKVIEPPVTEWFAINDSLWASTGLRPHDAILCIGCLESILGRKLCPRDFPASVPANEPHELMSNRLLDRLGGPRRIFEMDGEEIPEPQAAFEATPPLVDNVIWFGARGAAHNLGISIVAIIRLVRDGHLEALWHPLRIHYSALDQLRSSNP